MQVNIHACYTWVINVLKGRKDSEVGGNVPWLFRDKIGLRHLTRALRTILHEPSVK